MRCYTKRETKITPEVYSMRQLATKYASKDKIHCYIREKNFVKRGFSQGAPAVQERIAHKYPHNFTICSEPVAAWPSIVFPAGSSGK